MYTVVWYDKAADITREEDYPTLVGAQVRFNLLLLHLDKEDQAHLWIECQVGSN